MWEELGLRGVGLVTNKLVVMLWKLGVNMGSPYTGSVSSVPVIFKVVKI